MARILLRNARLLDPEAAEPRAASLLLEEGRVAALLGADASGAGDAVVIDLDGRPLAPGLIDLHWHGALPFTAPDSFADPLREASERRLAEGVTAFLPTTVVQPAAELAETVTRLAWTLGTERWPGAVPLGLHLEGPWISPDAAGAQPSDGIRPVDPGEAREILERGSGLVRMVTLAPEVPGAEALIEELGRREVVAALGHSRAAASQVERAIEAGARHVTHLWNAMSPLHHREPGLVGCALSDERLSFDLVCDGVHVDPRVVKIGFRAGPERLILITDRVEAVEAARIGGSMLREQGGAVRLADGRLAGSALVLDAALRNLRRFTNASLLESVKAATLRPARLLGLEAERGTFRPGARADLVFFDEAGRVLETWIAGECVYAVA
ncbi:N-acetylglucosamine-6-phosphate deacetylase [Gammaproteobacteria bacterium]|jgi:N-acetylglucosamine-6-phosphate deacetylase|nr:N-acetylglucosamine-6-phosphate deacetylase [Gammaproteobacteria bacterium]